MSRAARSGRGVSNRGFEQAGGVKIVEIAEDQSEMPRVYDPTHPDADEEGYLELPNVTLVAEVADAMAASQAFNANVTAFNALKQVVQRGLDIGV
jgi:flagellar basal-body rod protein FlgC